MNTMEKEVFITDDDLVLKMIHEDGSETSVKTVSSCDTIRNPKTGVIEHNNIERNKYSVFTSSSRGCPMSCDFCSVHTFNGNSYRLRPVEEVLDELETLEHNRRRDQSAPGDEFTRGGGIDSAR